MRKRTLLGLCCVVVFAACESGFPTAPRVGVPDDHTELQGGAAHKSGLDHPFTESAGCSASDCHKSDLRGGQVTFEGQVTLTPSCYQCHGEKWSDRSAIAARSLTSGHVFSLLAAHTS